MALKYPRITGEERDQLVDFIQETVQEQPTRFIGRTLSDYINKHTRWKVTPGNANILFRQAFGHTINEYYSLQGVGKTPRPTTKAERDSMGKGYRVGTKNVPNRKSNTRLPLFQEVAEIRRQLDETLDLSDVQENINALFDTVNDINTRLSFLESELGV